MWPFGKKVPVVHYSKNELVSIADAMAVEYSLPSELVRAVIYQESRWQPQAIRVELTLMKKLLTTPWEDLPGHKPKVVPSRCTERVARATSWGLMQVLGETARWACKFDGDWLSDLLQPEIGIRCGCIYLERCLSRAEGHDEDELIRDALLHYNGGGNEDYDDEVLSHISARRV